MAVIAVWKCDRDGTLFENKKDAEEHDKMLELAENITGLLKRNIANLDDEMGAAVGLLLAKHRDELAKACKGKPEVLLAIGDETQETPQEVENVAMFAAGQ